MTQKLSMDEQIRMESAMNQELNQELNERLFREEYMHPEELAAFHDREYAAAQQEVLESRAEAKAAAAFVAQYKAKQR